MKIKIFALLSALLLISNCFAASAKANEGINWYIKRSGVTRPALCEPHTIIEKYDGYYIDKKVSDTSDKRVIYLTFDAGYENGNVERILDILGEKNVKAAFFILDHPILSNTELIKRMSTDGHTVANHTKNHKDMTTLTDEQMRNNLRDLERIYEEKTGYTLSKYFRFPEGRYSERTLKCAYEMGYKTIFWSLGYADWDNDHQPDCESAKKLLLDNTHNGAVILLHPTSETNVKILPSLIDEWRKMGYTFGTLDELVCEN